eukprot:6849901-Heterocapsa_arctica.AAC.1
MKSYNFMIGLMANDIEAITVYDKSAKIEPDSLQSSASFRNAVAGRLQQFFGSTNPSATDMYTCRGRLSTEVTRETKLAQGAKARGMTHV